MAEKPSFHFLCFTLFSFIAYWNALTMDFIGDDISRIVDAQPYFQHGLSSTVSQVLPDRPFLMATMWLNFQLGGINPLGFKIVNVFLHGCVAFVLWKLLIVLFGHQHSSAAFLTILAFIVHPLNNQSINSVIQRGVILSTLGILMSLVFFIHYLRSSKTQYYFLSMFSFLLGLLSKQTAIILPLLLLLYLIVCEQRTWIESIKRVYPFLFFLLIPIVFYFVLHTDIQREALPWYEYLAIQTRVIFLYFKLFVFPFGLHFSHFIDPSPHLMDNLTWLAIIGHCTIFLSIFFGWTRGERSLCFCAISMYLCFLPESGIFSITHLAFEHRTYLPFLFIYLTIFWAVTRLNMRETLVQTIGLSIAFLLLMGTLSYNEKIHTFGKWVLHNVSLNSKDHHGNFYDLDRLFFTKRFASGKHVASFLAQEYPSNQHYHLFKNMFVYEESERNTRGRIIQEFRARLSDGAQAFDPRARGTFNLFLFARLSEFYPPVEVSKIIDDLVIAQLPEFRRYGEIFNNVYVNYLTHLNLLAHYYESRGPENLDHQETLRYLRVLVILKLYYNDDIPDLESRFTTALRKFPESTALMEMFQKATSRNIAPLPLPHHPNVRILEEIGP